MNETMKIGFNKEYIVGKTMIQDKILESKAKKYRITSVTRHPPSTITIIYFFKYVVTRLHPLANRHSFFGGNPLEL